MNCQNLFFKFFFKLAWNQNKVPYYVLSPLSLTHTLTLIVLVDEDVVQDKVEQLVLQRAVGVEHEGLEALPAARRQLVTEDHQQVTEKHERLHKEAQKTQQEKYFHQINSENTLRVEPCCVGTTWWDVTCSLTGVLTLDRHC